MLSKLFGLFAYAMFSLSFAGFGCSLLNLGPMGADAGKIFAFESSAARMTFDISLLLLFGVHHSIAARPWFKTRLVRLIPIGLERSVYVLVSSLLLLGIALFWQPLPDVIWSLTSPIARAVVIGVFALGLVTAVWATFLIDHGALTGLKQSGCLGSASDQGDQFRKPGLYRFVRHPMQLGILILLWATPTMSVGHLVLSLGMTLYIFIGLHFEEKALLRQFGSIYADYRRQVGKILPKF